MQFSEAQQEDLMQLRRIFGRLGVLDRQSKECMSKMASRTTTSADDIVSTLADDINLADQLKCITATQFQTTLQFTAAFHARGETTCSVLCLLSQSRCSSIVKRCHCDPTADFVAPPISHGPHPFCLQDACCFFLRQHI